MKRRRSSRKSVSTFLEKLKLNKKRQKVSNSGKAPLVARITFTTVVLVGFVLLIILIIRFTNSQVNELKDLKFSDSFEGEFTTSYLIEEMPEDQVFSLLIVADFGEVEKPRVDNLIVVQIDPGAEEVRLITLQPDLYFYQYDSPGVSASSVADVIRIRDLMVAGELKSPPMTFAYVYYEIQELLAIPINGYVYFGPEVINDFNRFSQNFSLPETIQKEGNNDKVAESTLEYWQNFIKTVSLYRIWRNRQLIPDIASNMSVTGLFEVLDKAHDINVDDFKLVYIDEEKLVESTNERGDIVYQIRQSAIDEALEANLGDQQIDREQARIEVFNGGEISGRGGRYGRWIKHIGGDVIRIENAPGFWDDSVIYVTDKEKFAYTVEKISMLWNGDIEVRGGRPSFLTTGDIIVVVGADR